MCLDNIKKWFCGECKPQIVEVEKEVIKEVIKEVVVEKIVTVDKVIKVPNTVINRRITPSRIGTVKIDKDNNIQIFDYLWSLNAKCGYYSQAETINTIKINRNEKTIILNDRMKLFSEGGFC